MSRFSLSSPPPPPPTPSPTAAHTLPSSTFFPARSLQSVCLGVSHSHVVSRVTMPSLFGENCLTALAGVVNGSSRLQLLLVRITSSLFPPSCPAAVQFSTCPVSQATRQQPDRHLQTLLFPPPPAPPPSALPTLARLGMFGWDGDGSYMLEGADHSFRLTVPPIASIWTG